MTVPLTPLLAVPINPRHYGAAGDGVTNDQAAVAAALAQVAVTGGGLFVPPGTYVLDTAPVVPPGVPVTAPGAFYTVNGGPPLPWTTAQSTMAPTIVGDFGASGSGRTYTVSTTAGDPVITVGPDHDFQVGQAIWAIHAGAPASYPAPTGLTFSPQANGSATPPAQTGVYQYAVSTCDQGGGISAAAILSISTGYVELFWRFWHKVAWTGVPGAASYSLWVLPPGGTWAWFGLTYNDFLVDFGQGAAGNSLGYAVSDQYPASPPLAALNQTLLTTIVAVTPTTITLADAPQATLSSTVVGHDDTAPYQAALDALANGTAAAVVQEANTTCYVQGLVVNSPQNVTLRGANRDTTILKLIPGLGANVLLLENPTQVTVAELTIDGNRVNTCMLKAGDDEDDSNGVVARGTASTTPATGVTYYRVRGQHTWMSGIKLGGANSAYTATTSRILDCSVSNSGDQGISIWNSTYVAVANAHVQDGGWAGLSFTQSDFCTAENVHSLYNTYFLNAPNSEGHAFAVEGGRGNRWVNCVGLYNNSWAFHAGIGPYSGERCWGNTFVGGVLGRTGKATEGVGLGYADDTRFVGTLIYGNAAEGVASATTNTGIALDGCLVAHNTTNGVDATLVHGVFTGTLFRGNLAAGVTGGGSNTDIRVVNCGFEANQGDGISLGDTAALDVDGGYITGQITVTLQETLPVIAATNGMCAGGSGEQAAMVGCQLTVRPEGIGAVFVYTDNGGSLGAAVTGVVWNDLDDLEVDWPQNGTNPVVGDSVIVQYQAVIDPSSSQFPVGDLIPADQQTVTIGGTGVNVTGTTNPRLRGLTVTNTLHAGMNLSACTGGLLDGCTVTASGGAGGIYLSGVTGLQIAHATVTGNSQSGIQLNNNGSTPTTGVVIRDSTITGNGNDGIQETGAATGNLYEGNVLTGNTGSPVVFATGSTSVARDNAGYNPLGVVASTTPVSGTAYTNSYHVPVTLYQPVSAATAGTAGTVTAALGPTSTTLTPVAVQRVSGSSTTAAPALVTLSIPPGWAYSLTVSGATLGKGTLVEAAAS
jgi:hypothetical protein